MQTGNEEVVAQAQAANAEKEQLKASLDTLKAETAASNERIAREREAAIMRLSEERATAIKQLTDEKNAEIERITNELTAKLAEEQNARKNDVAFYEQKIKFLNADHKRAEMELNATIAELKEKKSSIALDPTIEPIIQSAVAQTFGFDSAISGSVAEMEPVAFDDEPKIPNDIFETDSFSDDNIDATFAATEPESVESGSAEAAPEPPTTSIDELDDIDWLMPTPPSPPKVQVPEPEPAPAKDNHAKSDADKQQMSLF